MVECEALLAQAPDGEQAALCLADLAWVPGPFQKRAVHRLEELLSDHPAIPWFGIQLAALKRSSAPRDAERIYRQSIGKAEHHGLARAEVFARTGLVRLLRDEGRQKEAETELDQALEVAQESRDPKARVKAAVAKARHLEFLGELEQAYGVLLGIETRVDDHLQREYFFALASVAQQTGRFRETRDAYRRLIALGEKADDIDVVATARSGLATTLKEKLSELPSGAGRREVLELAHEALEATRAVQRPSLEVYPLWTIGSLSGDPAEARGYLERCLEVAATSQSRSFCQAVLARRLAGSDPAAAEEAIQTALGLAQKSGDPLSWTNSWHERMRLRWLVAPPDRALADSLSALDAIEALRDKQGGSSHQPGLFSTWAEDYYWLSGRLLELGRQEGAFEVIERMRARTLTDALGLQRPDVPPDLHARRAEVALDITRVQRRLMGGLSAPDREAAHSELRRLETEADGIRLRIQRSDPTLAGSHRQGFASLEQVRSSLGPDEALLSFQIAPWKDLAGDFGGGSWLLVSTRAYTRLYPLADRTELRPNVETFNGMFTARDGSEAEVAAVLYRKLLEPALAELPESIRRLVIVPDDALHRLPFAALRPEPDGEPLVERFQISLVPSATLWLRWRNEKTPMSGEPALVFADPPATGEGQATERAAAFGDRARLGALPLSREEGESVVDHLGGGSLLLLGEEASEARLKSAGTRGFRIVHFATHSWTDDVAPDRSFVYLARGSPDQDGLLQPPEIAELPLRGRMVVLSTCGSAAGEILRGEGVMGLARSFFQSGAHPVVASLWKLRDDDGAELFDRFYAHLAEGRSVADALQAAQRDRIEAGAPAFAWAGVVVLGDGDRVPLPEGRRPPRFALPVALAAAALALIGALIRGGRRQR